MLKSVSIFLVASALAAVSFAFKKEDPGYKNLKVLPKNIGEAQMDSIMHHFTISLGVDCDFCHVGNKTTQVWDYAADDIKHKLIARDMMRMTDKINDTYFDVTGGKRDLNSKLMVTCFTCHHGTTQPLVRPDLADSVTSQH
jgi:hypothetical protein